MAEELMGIESLLLGATQGVGSGSGHSAWYLDRQDMYRGPGVNLDCAFGDLVTVDDEATIVSGTRVLSRDAAGNRRLGLTWCAPVAVGKREHVGANARIPPGVSIGDDAVVATGTVVTGDVPAGALVASIPASPISSVVELDGHRRSLPATRRAFAPEYGASHMSRSRRALLRVAADGGRYVLRSASPLSAEAPSGEGTHGSRAQS